MISADEFSSGPDYATRVKCLLLWCSPPLSYSPFSLLLLFFYPQVICRHNIISPCCLRTRGNFLRVRSSLTMKHQFLSYKTSEGKGYKPLSHIKNILKRSGFVLFLVLLRPLVPPSQCCTAKHCLIFLVFQHKYKIYDWSMGYFKFKVLMVDNQLSANYIINFSCLLHTNRTKNQYVGICKSLFFYT